MPLDSFDYHAPTAPQLAFIEEQRSIAKAWRALLERLPICREKRIVMTKLEETLMWGNKAAALSGNGLAPPSPPKAT